MWTSCPTKRAGLWLLSHQHGLMSHQLGVLNPKARLKPSNEAGNQSNEANVPSNGGDLCDPDSQHPSLEPKADFIAVLQKKKKKKPSVGSYLTIKNKWYPWQLFNSVCSLFVFSNFSSVYTRARQRTSSCAEGHAEHNGPPLLVSWCFII